MSNLSERIKSLDDAFYFISTLNPCYHKDGEVICALCGATTGMGQISFPIHKSDCPITEAQRALDELAQEINTGEATK